MTTDDSSSKSACDAPGRPPAAVVATDRAAPARPIRYRLAAVFLGLILGLGIAEIVVRVAGIEPQKLITKRSLVNLTADPPVYYHCYPDNPHGEFATAPILTRDGWKLQDHTFEHHELPLNELARTPWCVEYRHSSKGIRDREFSPEHAEGTTRVAVIGDSFVFGEGVPEQLTLPRQIAAVAGSGVECINGGQVGANSEQEAVILDNIVRGTGSTRAILVFIANDIPMTQSLAQRQDYINDLVLIRDRYLERQRSRAWYTGHLRILDLAFSPWDMRRIRRDTIQWYRDCYDLRLNGANLSQMRSRFTEMAQRTDCHSVLVLYPLLEGLESDYPLQSVHDTVARLAEEAGLPVLDLTPAFAGRKTSSLWVHEGDHHPNGTAHKIAAEAIVAWLREKQPDFLPSTAKMSAGNR